MVKTNNSITLESENFFRFATYKDIKNVANIITDGRFKNDNGVYIYDCPFCEGYGFINEKIIFYDEYQLLEGELCLYCGGRGKLTFTEFFFNPPPIDN